ncbi:NnrU family protein [Mesobaculum littorinae]|uniref:NnrU family protein n=1 Tax=Mesobaculum littorinae TaxID=2486419 RepID=A0A438AHT7_9RHOB|nr:NnrU family protein [Mesobaculum littorinae]RVV98266.1 NnrU family protein [Mesobaculum littorinae]
MTGWSEYALALGLFVASHFLPRVGGLRQRLIGALGRRAYFGAYGILSLALLIWVISAAIRAPYVGLWPALPWTRWVPNLAMPLALVLLACGVGLRSPFTLGGRRGADVDPADPGFAAVSRHPLFLALALWSGAHLVANGDLALAILFGSFLAMALSAIPAFDTKARRTLGPRAPAFFAATAILSPAPLLRRAWLRVNGRALAIRVGLGLLSWVCLLHLHEYVIGVSPFPL